MSSAAILLVPLTLHAFLSSVDFFFFLNLFFFFKKKKKSFRNTIRVSNSLELDQARRFVGPDLGPSYLQRLSADEKSHLLQGKS